MKVVILHSTNCLPPSLLASLIPLSQLVSLIKTNTNLLVSNPPSLHEAEWDAQLIVKGRKQQAFTAEAPHLLIWLCLLCEETIFLDSNWIPMSGTITVLYSITCAGSTDTGLFLPMSYVILHYDTPIQWVMNLYY